MHLSTNNSKIYYQNKNTISKTILSFEELFIIFRVTPFSRDIARSLLKEPKLYFFDQGMVSDNKGAALENMVAVSLYKHILNREEKYLKPALLYC